MIRYEDEKFPGNNYYINDSFTYIQTDAIKMLSYADNTPVLAQAKLRNTLTLC